MFKKKKEETVFVVRMGYDDIYVGISIYPVVFRNLKDAEKFVLGIFKDRKPKTIEKKMEFDKYIHREYAGHVRNLEIEREEYLDGWVDIYEVRVR